MPCPLCFNWATSDFICLPKRVCFNASWQNENKPTWEAHEMGAGGLPWPGTEMMSPLPSAGPWATLPLRLCLSLLKWTHYKTTLMYPGDTRWNALCDTQKHGTRMHVSWSWTRHTWILAPSPTVALGQPFPLSVPQLSCEVEGTTASSTCCWKA